MRGAELLARGTRTLTQADVPDAGNDARHLLAHVLKVPKGRLTLFLSEDVDPDLEVIFNVMIERRSERVPVSHLTGRRAFFGRDFLVTPEALDPRPETETLIEAALAEPFESVLDLGTGSGCILLTLLAETEGTWGVGTDLSAAALNVAFWNRNALRLEDRAGLEEGRWFDPVSPRHRFDLIVSNPPYIALDELSDLAPEVREYEPRLALTDEGDGLGAYREILVSAADRLNHEGRLIMEIGHLQGPVVASMMREAGFREVMLMPDLDGRDRVVIGRKSAISG